MVRQSHLGGREPLHPAQSLDAKEGGKEMLPGPDVKPVVLHGGRRRHRMAPRTAQPLDAPAIPRIAGDRPQAVEDIAQPHRVQAVEQRAGVIEHDAGLLALGDKLGG